MRRQLWALLLSCLMAAGCHFGKTKIEDLPADVTEKEVKAWYAATGIAKNISETTVGLTDAIISINSSAPGLIQSEDYQNILLVLGKTAQAGIHVDNILRTVPDHFGKDTKEKILAEMRPVMEELRKADLEGLFARTQSPRFQIELNIIKRLMNAIQLLISIAQ